MPPKCVCISLDALPYHDTSHPLDAINYYDYIFVYYLPFEIDGIWLREFIVVPATNDGISRSQPQPQLCGRAEAKANTHHFNSLTKKFTKFINIYHSRTQSYRLCVVGYVLQLGSLPRIAWPAYTIYAIVAHSVCDTATVYQYWLYWLFVHHLFVVFGACLLRRWMRRTSYTTHMFKNVRVICVLTPFPISVLCLFELN